MRVNTIIKSSKHDEQRQSNNRNIHNNKQNKENSNDVHIPFSEVLKKVKKENYFQ